MLNYVVSLAGTIVTALMMTRLGIGLDIAIITSLAGLPVWLLMAKADNDKLANPEHIKWLLACEIDKQLKG